MFNSSSTTNTSFGMSLDLGSSKKDFFNSSTSDFFDPPPPPGGPGSGGRSPLFNQPFLDLVPYQVIDLSFLRKFEVFNSILNAFGDLFSSKTQITPMKDFLGSKSPFPLHSKLDIFDASSIPPIILQCYGAKVISRPSSDGGTGPKQVAQEKTSLDLSKLSSHLSATFSSDGSTRAEQMARVAVFIGELADLQKLQVSGLDLRELKYRFHSGFVTLADVAIEEGHLHILEYLGGDIRALRFLCKKANQGCKLPAVCAASKGKREVLQFLAKRAYPFQFTELRLGTLHSDSDIDMRDIKQEDLLKMENVMELLGIEKLSKDQAWFYFRVLRICLLTDPYFDEISAALIEGKSSATAEFLINLKLEGQTVSPQERALALVLSAPAALDLFLTLSSEPIDFDQLVKDVSRFICLNKKIPPGNPKSFQNAYMATIKKGQGYELIQVKRPKRQALLNFLEYAYCNDSDLSGVTAECLNSFNENNEKILPLIIMMNLAKKGDVTSLIAQGNLQPEDPYLGRTLAHAAAATGQTKVLEFLVESGISFNKKDNLGQRPIHLAALHGHQSTIELLIGKHCERSLADDSGNSPLHLAASNGHTLVVKFLGECERNLQNKHGLRPAHFAAEGGHLEFLQELKNNGASMHIKDEEGEDIFHAAAYNGHLNILQAARYLDPEQDFSGKNNNGKTVTDIAVEGGFLEIVKWLRHKGFIVNTPDENGKTPAQVAESLGYAEIKKVILSSNNSIKAYAPFIGAICLGVVTSVALAALFPQDLP